MAGHRLPRGQPDGTGPGPLGGAGKGSSQVDPAGSRSRQPGVRRGAAGRGGVRGTKRPAHRWAARVRDETARHLPKFRQNPSEYQNSEAYFRMLALVTVL
jgi:hypothetical protein